MSAVRNFLITFLLSLLIFGMLAYMLVRFTTSAFELGKIGTDEETTPEQTEAPETQDAGSVTPDDWIDIKGDSFTALLIGIDYQPDVYNDYTVSSSTLDQNGFPKEARRIEADTVILIRVNKETGECIFCAVPAITRITVDGLVCQLQDLYSLKGVNALCDKVMAMTGIPIDYYAVITMSHLSSLIDDIGGITFFVETDMHYVDETIGLNINLRRGSQKLNGKKAVDMLRYFSYADGDTSRRKCAVSFLKELFKKVLAQNKMENAAFTYASYAKYVETNFTISDLGDYVELLFTYPKMTLRDYTYPGTTVGTGKDAYFTANISRAIEYFSQFKYKG